MAHSPAPPRRRADVQGLRAVAVGLVVAHHLTGWPSGGFLGVDVFFVVSGFLITGLLLEELESSGRLSFGAFYLRRARRILPAALLVLMATLVGTRLLLLEPRFDEAATDAGWASVFLLNWHEAAAGTDYFDDLLPPSPLQHYWSLAVEEQFYVLWPLLLLGAALLARRLLGSSASPAAAGGGARVRVAAGMLAAAVLAASLAWAWVQSAGSPTAAYFSTATRAWELAAGAVLAVLAPRLRHLPTWSRNALGAVGVAGVVGTCLVVDGASAVPAPAAVPAVAATVLLLASGIGVPHVAATAVLRLPPLVYLGELSFVLYLWHWPVIVLGQALTGSWTVPVQVGAAAVTLALAVLTHHLVEEPLRRPRGARGRSTRRPHVPRSVSLGALGVVAASLVVALLTPAVADDPAPSTTASLTPAGTPADETPRPGADPQAQVRRALLAALEAEDFPALDPPLDDAVEQGINPEMEPESGCLNPPSLTDPDLCVHGAGAKRAMLVGDSVAIAWMPAVRAALGRGWTVRGLALSNCPFADVGIEIPEDPDGAQRCLESRATLHEQVRAAEADLVIVSDFELGLYRVPGEPPARTDAWQRGVADAVRAVAAEGTRVAVLAPPPAGHTAADCVTRLSSPADCVGPPSPAWLEKSDAERAAAAEVGATYIDTRPWFCVDDRCPLFAGTTLLRWDLAHVTRQYARLLGPVLRQALEPVLDGS